MIRRMIAAAMIAMIQTYRYTLARVLPRACRFEPSCSAFALEAIRRHGPWRGLLLGCGRLVRCHPFAAGGDDPVP
jgi:hypothetical protein